MSPKPLGLNLKSFGNLGPLDFSKLDYLSNRCPQKKQKPHGHGLHLWASTPTGLRSTWTTRLLLTVIPAQHYAANGATMHAVLRAVVDDFNILSECGIEVVGLNRDPIEHGGVHDL